MVIAGSQGHAHEVFEILKLNGINNHEIAFFDDVNLIEKIDTPSCVVFLKSMEEVKSWMESINDYRYVYGLGGISAKKNIYDKFNEIGGILNRVLAPSSTIGKEKVVLGNGIQVMHQVCITTKVTIGNHCLLNAGSHVMHDVIIGDQCDIAPAAIILGRVIIGDYCFIGSNSTILPDLIIGDNVTIGAGAVVTKNIPANAVVVGVPAKIIKYK